MKGIWIRSQDSTKLVFANRIEYAQKPFLGSNEEHCILANNILVAQYPSKERAIEVINMIWDFGGDSYAFVMPKE